MIGRLFGIVITVALRATRLWRVKMSGLSDNHAEWLLARGIETATALKHGLSSQGPGIAIPYQRGGETIYHKIINPEDKTRTRCHPTGIEQTTVWNSQCLSGAPNPTDMLVITEGEWDALTILQEGYPFVVSLPSGTQDSLDGARKKARKVFTQGSEDDPVLRAEFEKFKRIAVLADGDQAGLYMREAIVEIFGADYCWVPTYPIGTKDANDVLTKQGHEHLAFMLANLTPIKSDGFITFPAALKSAPTLKPLDPGLQFLRPHFRPVRPSFIVVGAQAGHGKSTVVQALVYNLIWANPDLKVSFFHAEGDITIPINRSMSFWRGAANPTTVSEQKKRERDHWMEEHLAFIKPPQDQPPTFEWLLWTMERQAIARGRNVFVVDPWNQVLHTGNYRSKTDYIGDCIYKMKRLADRHGLILIVAHHTTKEIDEHKPPNRYALADSAHWVNAADHVLMLWRKPGETDRTRIEVAKSKDHHAMGDPGTVWVRLGSPFTLNAAINPDAPKLGDEELPPCL